MMAAGLIAELGLSCPADISLAGKLMGYQPVAGFEEGLARTVEWYRTRETRTPLLSET